MKLITEGIVEVLNYEFCPVIKNGTKVIIDHIYDFPATGKKFVTIIDFENHPLDRHGNPTDIISTIPLDDKTFIPSWVPRG